MNLIRKIAVLSKCDRMFKYFLEMEMEMFESQISYWNTTAKLANNTNMIFIII